MKGLRQACTRLARYGYTVDFVDPATIERARVHDLVDLMGKSRRGEGERGFSMMLGRMFHARDRGLLLTIVSAPDGSPAAICQFVPSPAINGYSLDLMRRDPDEHPNGLIDYALCSTIAHLRERGARGLSLNFAAFRSVLDGEKGDGTFTRVERWALRRLSGVLPIETLWSFNAKYLPDWQPRYLVYPGVENLVPVVAAVLRAESLTEHGVNVINDGELTFLKADTVVIAVGVKQENTLVKELRETAPGLRLHVIGDCYDPRTALEAIHEGFKVGTEI